MINIANLFVLFTLNYNVFSWVYTDWQQLWTSATEVLIVYWKNTLIRSTHTHELIAVSLSCPVEADLIVCYIHILLRFTHCRTPKLIYLCAQCVQQTYPAWYIYIYLNLYSSACDSIGPIQHRKDRKQNRHRLHTKDRHNKSKRRTANMPTTC